MQAMRINNILRNQPPHALIRGIALMGAALIAGTSASAQENTLGFDVPPSLNVPPGNTLHIHAFGRGFQVYTWNGSTWGAATPEAMLVDAEGNLVSIHFGGPSWASADGSKVVGTVLPAPVTVDANAIPWLLLKATHTEGPGTFAATTFVQRLNTTGGKAPSRDGAFVGQVARVPYTADYLFYQSAGQ